MKMTITFIILILLCIFPVDSYSAEEGLVDKESKVPNTEIVETEEDSDNLIEENLTKETVIKENVVELEKSSGLGLKQKNLSKAFEEFIPSEKISADNAVPFPVDI
jgi:hypothetical protein